MEAALRKTTRKIWTFGPPRQPAFELVEQRVLARHPARHVVDPRTVRKLRTPERAEATVERRRAGREQIELAEHTPG